MIEGRSPSQGTIRHDKSEQMHVMTKENILLMLNDTLSSSSFTFTAFSWEVKIFFFFFLFMTLPLRMLKNKYIVFTSWVYRVKMYVISFPGYRRTCAKYEFSHKCETKIEGISHDSKMSGHLKEKRVVLAEVTRKRSNWHAASASGGPDMPQRL